MHAGVNSAQDQPGMMDEFVSILRESVLPVVRGRINLAWLGPRGYPPARLRG